MNECYLCGSNNYLEILRKPDVHIWTDTGDNDSMGKKYRCDLNQCVKCGHVYQPVDEELRNIFIQIYRSRTAQGLSPMGIGKWGMERANTHFLNAIDLKEHKTAAEIGCGDGYLLRHLREFGFEKLFGIEPSVNAGKDGDGTVFINEFADEKLHLSEKVDLIFSVAVFEHIENINGILSFCRNNLKADGELFFVVPNAQKQLESGDPALFIHQHVHYFTERSIKKVLSKRGFRVNSIISREDAFHVSACIGELPSERTEEIVFYNQYEQKLNRVLENLRSLFSGKNVLVHGACNAMNNISCWIESDFQLADNDENKQGKRYFNKTVMSPVDIDPAKCETIIIIPKAYYRQIMALYLEKGFKGKFAGVECPD